MMVVVELKWFIIMFILVTVVGGGWLEVSGWLSGWLVVGDWLSGL